MGAGAVAHERSDPNHKYLFVCDENGILGAIVHDPTILYPIGICLRIGFRWP